MSQPDPPGERKIRLAILAPTLATRLGLRYMLQDVTNLEIVAEAASLNLLEVPPGEVDLLLAVEEVFDRESFTSIPETLPAVLLLSNDPQAGTALMTMPLPAWGVLTLDPSPEELKAAIQALMAGLWVGDPALMPRMPLNTFRTDDLLPDDATLTQREIEVLQGLAQGLANKQIGLALGISEHTVKFHITSIYTKLGAVNRAEAVRIGIQKGWVTL